MNFLYLYVLSFMIFCPNICQGCPGDGDSTTEAKIDDLDDIKAEQGNE